MNLRDVEEVIKSNIRDLLTCVSKEKVLGRFLVMHSAKNPIEHLHTSPDPYLNLRDVEGVIRNNIRDLIYLCTETEGLGSFLVTHSAKNSIESYHTSPGA